MIDVNTEGFDAAFARTAELLADSRQPVFAVGFKADGALAFADVMLPEFRYYHHSQQGSWSIKAVLPAAVPELSYDALEGVQGGAAMEAFSEAIQCGTTDERKSEIERQLLAYCRLITFAMVRLWRFSADAVKRRCKVPIRSDHLPTYETNRNSNQRSSHQAR